MGVGLVGYPVTLTVGGIGTQPVLRDGQLDNREQLCLTVSLDHEVIDGAPGVRFGRRLRELIEQGYGLELIGDGDGLGQRRGSSQRAGLRHAGAMMWVLHGR
jgi:hypothetical protein